MPAWIVQIAVAVLPKLIELIFKAVPKRWEKAHRTKERMCERIKREK